MSFRRASSAARSSGDSGASNSSVECHELAIVTVDARPDAPSIQGRYEPQAGNQDYDVMIGTSITNMRSVRLANQNGMWRYAKLFPDL